MSEVRMTAGLPMATAVRDVGEQGPTSLLPSNSL